MRRLVVSALVLVAPGMRAAAQDARPPEPAKTISIAFGVHYGVPMRTSASIGVLSDAGGSRNDGFVAMVEPAQQGGEVSAGYFHMLGSFGSGYSVRAALLRTGGEPWNASAHTTYVGVEAHWMLIFGVGGRVGYLRRASRSVTDPHDHVVSLGVSIGS